jgi:tRNA(Ile)-lysidine synthase TilS/MesJ
MEKYREIEKSIIKKYRKEIWSKFIKGINTYQLINDGDKIAVCISGGKDSNLLAKCMQELKRHGQINFEVEYILMDPGYSEENIHIIEENAKQLNIPLPR